MLNYWIRENFLKPLIVRLFLTFKDLRASKERFHLYGSASGGMPSQSKRQRHTADITKSFSERDHEVTPKGRRVCVVLAEKSLVQSGSECSEAVPIPAKPLLIFGGCHE